MSKLKKIKLSDIDKGSRARKEYKKVKELWQSITEHGQIQPISVIEKDKVADMENDFDVSKEYLLLAGGRRMAAFEYGEAEEIEAKIYDEFHEEIEILKIELYENLDREDLTWTEEVELKAKIQQLEEDVADSEGTKASIRGTASKLNVSHGNLSEDLKLAEAIKAVPTLKRHKTKSDAKKELKQMMKRLDDKEAVEKIKTEREADGESTLQKKIASKYKTKDILEGLQLFDDGTVDLVELDPPLQLGFEEIDRYDHSSYNEVTADDYPNLMTIWLKECYRVMKDNSWIIVWYPIEPWHTPVLEIMEEVGFKTRGIPLVWNKINGTSRAANLNLGNAYEVAFYGRKGSPVLEQPGRPSVFTYKKPDQSKRFHPTEKPIELYEEILQTFCRKGSICVSGFGGSGNIVLAAQNVNRDCTAFDTSTDWKNKFDLKVYDGAPPNYSSYK